MPLDMMKLEGILIRILMPGPQIHHLLQVGSVRFSSKEYIQKICLHSIFVVEFGNSTRHTVFPKNLC